MPPLLRAACLVLLASLCAFSAIVSLHEAGTTMAISLLSTAAFAAIIVQFMRRRPWAWEWLKWIAIAGIVVNAAFFPDTQSHGKYITVAQLTAVLEIASCALLLWAMHFHLPTKHWYRNG